MEQMVTNGSSFVGVILNPAAAGGRALGTLPRVVDTLKQITPDFSVFVTSGPGEAPAQATKFANEGASVVLAVGGDGTFNEVANGLLAAERQVPIGIVAAGRGCDFPRTVETPRKVEEAVELACRGTSMPIDVGLATCSDGKSRYFLNIAGLGFDAHVAERATKSRLPGGMASYMAALAMSLADLHPINVSIDADGETIETAAIFVSIANATYLAGGFKMMPMADIQDGKIDLAIIGDIGRAELVKMLPRVLRGSHVTHPKFTHKAARTITVTADEPALVQVDGELLSYAPVTFQVCPQALLLAR